jgi:hypothetical protein
MSVEFFGKFVWQNLQSVPLGGLSKRELLLPLLRAQLNRAYFSHSETLAKSCAIPLTLANG